MTPFMTDPEDSGFMSLHIPELLSRFSLSYELHDTTCIDYFLFSKEKLSEISRSLIVSHDVFSHSLYVSKFYPEIYKELECKYLSAACFYLIAHHAIQQFHLCDHCCINLETDTAVYDSFYSRLDDFNFKVQYHRPSDRVCLKGWYHEMPFKTDMIGLH